MKYAIRYQSRGGNTRAVAEKMAEILGITVETIDTPVNEKIGILFIGGGLYKWVLDEKLKEFLENINPEKIGKIIPFGTSGGQELVIKEITKFAQNKGIKVDENKLCVKFGLKGHSWLGLKGGKLNAKQIKKIEDFTNDIIKNN